MKPKIIAMYLPQFHQIPENDEFWGEGFTDWVTVKNAKPLFEGHRQPRVPLNNNYYDLSIKENVEWQCKLAHDYGIYGFGVYHYWFNNEKNLLTKPAEIMRDDENIQTKYFLVWDNCNWKRSWSNVSGNDWAPISDLKTGHIGPSILIPHILGDKLDWEKHYRYLSSHFHSERYEKKDGRPVFSIFHYEKDIDKMCKCWDELAKEDGFNGMCFIFKYLETNPRIKNSYCYNYEPHHTDWSSATFVNRVKNKLKKIFHVKSQKDITIYNYDETWMRLIKYTKKHNESSLFHGAFVDYDDSPRRGKDRARLIEGVTPEKFEKYLKDVVSISVEQKKDYIFLTAWNEWGEGAYLEPDEENGYGFLKGVEKVMKEYNHC